MSPKNWNTYPADLWSITSCAPEWHANAVKRSFKPHCHRARLSAVGLAPVFWRMCWLTRTQITFRFTVNRRYLPVRGLIWIDRRWRAGLDNRQSCWNPWPIPSDGMFVPVRPSLPMTPRSRCKPKRNAPPHVFGLMCATNGPGPVMVHPQRTTSSARTGKASIPPTI